MQWQRMTSCSLDLWFDKHRFALDFHDDRLRVLLLYEEWQASCCISEHDHIFCNDVIIWAGTFIFITITFTIKQNITNTAGSRTTTVIENGKFDGNQGLLKIVTSIVIPKPYKIYQDDSPPHWSHVVRAPT